MVGSGVVSVGVSPSITSMTPNIIQQGATATIDLMGARSTGLASAQFDNPALIAEILPGATNTQASISVKAGSTAAAGLTQARFLVDAGEIKVTDALTVVPTQPILEQPQPIETLYLGAQGIPCTSLG